MISILRGAVRVLDAGLLSDLIDGIRAEAESDVLEQAEELLGARFLAAGAVLAGSALETHLRHLCGSNGFTWKNEGSIAKYRAALDQARNAGHEIISKNEGKQVEAWGGIRNDGVHSPEISTPSTKSPTYGG
ncbi:MAG: hypothetical protein AAGA56_16375 [Myxococcota bacterium]